MFRQMHVAAPRAFGGFAFGHLVWSLHDRCLVSHVMPLFVSSRNAPPHWGGTLRDETNNVAVVGDYHVAVVLSLIFYAVSALH